MLLGVDVGGTFTDAVLFGDGLLVTAKSPTTPEDQSRGVMAAVTAVLDRAGRGAADVTVFAHGMTVATNALLEGRSARTALIATAGFADVVELGRQARADLYRLCAAHPAPLVPPALRFEAPERMTPDGPLRPLARDDAAALARRVAAAEPEAVAVTLLHAYRHPEHELALREALVAALPQAHVSLSHEVVGTFREYERAATTEIDAALSPLVGRYLRRLAERAAAAGLPEPAIMQSNGGLIDLGAAAGHAAWTVLSGPAGGAEGAAFAAADARVERALCFDMGGTSCDVCVVHDGAVAESAAGRIAGRPIALPTLDVHTVGAGGGSIAWRDAGGALRVGPQSAGAQPGPACYGRGGELPTVTDANLLLGYLPPDAPLSETVALDLGAARAAVTRLAEELGIAPLACAEGIVRVANAEMTRALRVVTVERGIDPRDHALVAFGGAGPLHAAAIADELGIDRVLAPRASGVLAAFGLVVAPRRRDAQRSVLRSGEALTAEAVAADVAALARQARAALGEADAEIAASYALRYRGQAFELTVDGPPQPTPAALREAFEQAHERRYGYRDAAQQIELVTVRVRALVASPAADGARLPRPLPDDAAPPVPGRREARLDGEQVALDVWRGALPPGLELRGPAVCELPESTLLVPAGWRGVVLESGGVELTREVAA
ncbi:hydantoinase/oxoprolinase family protein [Conexibacter sp. JD483]|uniref:hydantoinase/oxoprolinase family protein n=1 Tax=unclassified Conexibacter TaxID=2627773 RepID=UPI002727045C|nr:MULTISPECIES: hydantoinase/oxoprolinase family protein [unclassified Conexibacter]MDO8188068.1 hydantoinase/oxoprolinase family protein [Conexibacter sp. CPCC 205706]MDO8200490.1 hydantoinase/oxoprolinase family protein [Conexibacter sp. CPCC 205762]MDR9369837.1 hydantoinase/oxoprolinase family protein [Conexibacter sp. JD483]